MATIAPLIVVAYIDPTIQAQKNQEALVAKYPVAIVSSGMGTAYITWRNTVKALNPLIKLLGYVLGNERTNQNNPGKTSWAAVPSNSTNECNYIDPNTGLTVYPQLGLFRLFDWRSTAYHDAFQLACAATLNNYPYDGIFLDNSGVFNIAQPDTVGGTPVAPVNGQTPAQIRADMQAGYQQCITDFRAAHPGILIITNWIPNYTGANGGMVEGHPERRPAELPPYVGQSSPGMDVGLRLDTAGTYTDAQILADMNDVHSYGANAFFAYTKFNYQTITWPAAVFDPVIAAYPPDPPATPPPLRIRIV